MRCPIHSIIHWGNCIDSMVRIYSKKNNEKRTLYMRYVTFWLQKARIGLGVKTVLAKLCYINSIVRYTCSAPALMVHKFGLTSHMRGSSSSSVDIGGVPAP